MRADFGRLIDMIQKQNFEKELELAKDVAVEAGQLINKLAKKPSEIKYKGQVDLVTNADLEAEKLIIGRLKEAFGEYEIISEESATDLKKDAEYVWVIDPLDGTTNYAHRFPIYCVSIALVNNSKSVVGAVYEPNIGEMFSASVGDGAFLNGKPISVSDTKDLDKSLLATGFPYDIRENPKPVLNLFSSFALQAQGVRRAGAAALDICYLASGRLDGFWELGLKPWDMAAGSLIALEAGAKFSKFNGSSFDIWTPEVLATNGYIHDQMMDVIKTNQ